MKILTVLTGQSGINLREAIKNIPTYIQNEKVLEFPETEINLSDIYERAKTFVNNRYYSYIYSITYNIDFINAIKMICYKKNIDISLLFATNDSGIIDITNNEVPMIIYEVGIRIKFKEFIDNL